MSSKTYIVCWDGALDNCKDIETQLKDSDVDYTFYNVSSFDYSSPNWVRSEDIRYYGHFFNAVYNFLQTDKEVFIFNAGDVVYDDYVGYTKKIENLFAIDPDVYVFAPSFDNDAFSEEGSLIQESSIHDGLYLATHTNGIITALRRDLVHLLYEFYCWAKDSGRIDFQKIYSGWGLDTVYNSYAIYLNKKIYRDHVTMHHPLGSSYDSAAAYKEMDLIVEESKRFAQSKHMNPFTLGQIHHAITSKVSTKCIIAVEDLYLNLRTELTI